MLLLVFKGRLGNQMFQYATVRTLADQKGYRVHLTGANTEICDYFNLAPGQVTSHLWRKLLARTHRQRHSFTPVYGSYKDCVNEKFDPSFFDIEDGTRICGWFQSGDYFANNRENVLKWFTPRAHYEKRAAEIEAQWPVPVEKRCCLHVRTGDYLDLGWSLPTRYYEKALRQLPEDLFYIIVTDGPEYAEREFSFLPRKQILCSKASVVDMLLMARCRYVITANSSFSYWGAWRNVLPNAVIIAPKYYLGWRAGDWTPDRIQVPGWNYIDVLD